MKLNNKVYHIADSAIYSDDNITELGEHTLWITRVPATITEVKDLLNTDIELKSCTDIRYLYFKSEGMPINPLSPYVITNEFFFNFCHVQIYIYYERVIV